MNRINLTSENNNTQQTNGKHQMQTNGHQHSNGHTNGQVNLTFDIDSSDNNNSKSKPILNKSTRALTTKGNGYSNGHGHLNEHDDSDKIDLAPQKSSSPLIKSNGQTNGSAHCTNGSGNVRVNKV